MLEEIDEVLQFWFSPEVRPLRFKQNDHFDQQIREKFGIIYEKAANEELEHWVEVSPQAAVALVVILDQFPRNMFRGGAKAFQTDHLALKYAKAAIGKGWDHQLNDEYVLFLYLPFQHSESKEIQEESVKLFVARESTFLAKAVVATLEHKQTIDQFGRFPYRNKALGRESTDEELIYLKKFTS